MDAGEDDDAEAVELDEDVEVFADAADGAFEALEDAGGDADALSDVELAVDEDFGFAGGVGGEEPEQVDVTLADGADAVVVGESVDPEAQGEEGVEAAGLLEGKGGGFGGADEQDVGDEGALAVFVAGDGDCAAGEEDFVDVGSEGFFGQELTVGADCVPV